MAVIIAIIGASGDGKTTSTIINPDGSFDMDNYQGMDPKSHLILNLDKKTLPFPTGMWSVEQKNYAEPTTFADIKKFLEFAAKDPNIKSVSLDTINIYLSMREFNDRKKMTFDQ